MTLQSAFGIQGSGWPGTAPFSTPHAPSQTFAVHLIDRRTGAAHRINGTPLVIYTQRPDDAAQDLLAGRDAAFWDVQVQPLGRGPAR